MDLRIAVIAWAAFWRATLDKNFRIGTEWSGAGSRRGIFGESNSVS
jgi:hypothetical protein